MELILFVIYIIALTVFAVFSYGFVDLHLTLSSGLFYTALHTPLQNLVFHNRPAAVSIYLAVLIVMTAVYVYLLRHGTEKINRWVIMAAIILLVSFPAVSYDIFNYITTAKVTYTYHENPYVVMPVEIPNEPYLSFTRAANKYALYGPVWILVSALPHATGMGHIWQTILAFKFMNVLAYALFIYFIFAVTKSKRNVLYFALNPLVLMEVIVNGHNDIYMMIPALLALYLWHSKKMTGRILSVCFLCISWFVKGATLVLLPLYFFRHLTPERQLRWAFWLLLGVFLLIAPLREELYPWYAVWIISVAALLPYKTNRLLVDSAMVFSFALELRPLPYMWMGYYEGPGPLLRTILTVAPMVCYVLYLVYRRLAHENL